MKTFCLSSTLLAIAVGCGQSSPPPMTGNPTAAVPIDEALPEGAVLVTLKLPEMT